MNKFEIGREYKTIRKNGEIGVRTFKVEKISRKHMMIMVSGAINGVFPIKEDVFNGTEIICLGFAERNYQNPFATDAI